MGGDSQEAEVRIVEMAVSGLEKRALGQIFCCLSNDSFSLVPRKIFSLPCNNDRFGECPGKAREPRSLIQGLDNFFQFPGY